MMNLELFCISNLTACWEVNASVRSDTVKTLCQTCNRARYSQRKIYYDRLVIDLADGKWPDIIGCFECNVVSERVVNDLVDNNITGFEAEKFTKLVITPKNIPASMSYYHLKATGCAAFLPILPPELPNPVCPACGCWDINYRFQNGTWLSNYPYKIAHWDGQDIVDVRYKIAGMDCCSRRVIELARLKRWTNFNFTHPNTCNVRVWYPQPNWEELFLVDLKKEWMSRFPKINLPIPDFFLKIQDSPVI